MHFKNSKIIKKNIQNNHIVAKLDLPSLHKYILKNISNEFSEMVGECYYPKVASLYKELLHRTSSRESDLISYSKEKYKIMPYSKNKNMYRLLYDPYTTLLIIIIQEFLKQKDIAGAEAAFHLFALRSYTNLLYKYTISKAGGSKQPLCVPEYFKEALSKLSANHIFNTKKTIANSVMYFSRTTFQKYIQDLKKDNSEQMAKMIYEIKSKLNQSMKSFFNKYYSASKEKNKKTKDEEQWDETHETQLKYFISNIVRDMCIYKKVDLSTAEQVSKLIKFNQKLSAEYAKELANPEYSEEINVAYYLLMRSVKDFSVAKQTQFLDHVKKLMAVKTSKQPLYFKKVIIEIHSQLIKKLKLTKWFDNLSIQSKSISRNFIAYYIALFLKNYV